MELLSIIKLLSGQVLQKGDWIRLSDKVSDVYKQTKYYDISIESPKEFQEYDEQDFKFIELLPEMYNPVNMERDKVSINAHKILSLFEDKFDYFKLENGISYGYSSYFKIELENAFKYQELEILKNKHELLFNNQEHEIKLIKTMQEIIDGFSIGLLLEEELQSQLELQNYFYFNMQNKWIINNYRSIGGEYLKKSNS